jgi:hypothetical protein
VACTLGIRYIQVHWLDHWLGPIKNQVLRKIVFETL